jgi:hypothetical protein
MSDATPDRGRTGEVTAFERLYQRAPTDAERLRLVNIQRALGLEPSSEWWLFFLACETAAGRVDESVERVNGLLREQAEAFATSLAGLSMPAELSAEMATLVAQLGTARGELEILAGNIQEQAVQSAVAQTDAASQSRMQRIEKAAIESIRTSVVAGVADALKGGLDRLEEVIGTIDAVVPARVEKLIGNAHAISLKATLRFGAVFGGAGFVVGLVLMIGLMDTGIVSTPLDPGSADWLQWALSEEGQAARRLGSANAAAGGLNTLAHCTITGAHRDGAICTAKFTSVP